ncbi:cell division protein FtsZ [Candidatus Micrarchaeota archaeon]|nr:cell division protein FtsZ [Candidatus Micrarchaeota archaeon]
MGLIEKLLTGEEKEGSASELNEIQDENVKRLEEEEEKRRGLEQSPESLEKEENEVPPERIPKPAPEKPLSKDDEELKKFLDQSEPKIFVVGSGGSGCNTLNRMIEEGGVHGSRIVALNTDAQHLFRVSKAERKLLLGKQKTKGSGAGSNPQLGKAAAEESYKEIKHLLADANMVFVTCGMGGGTGTGSASVVAQAAKENGALVIGIVTMPFTSEGHKRMHNAIEGLKALRQVADTTIAIPNDKLLFFVPDLPLNQAFRAADEVLANAVRGIAELITKPGLINLDFADVKTIIESSGIAMIGLGENSKDQGKDRVVDAAHRALQSPLLDLDLSQANKALVHITGGEDMTLGEAEAAVNAISAKIAKEAHVIWGATVEKELTGKGVKVLAVLSGIQDDQHQKQPEVAIEETLNLEFIT